MAASEAQRIVSRIAINIKSGGI